MNPQHKLIVEESKKFVIDLFKEKLPPWAVYHDLHHTIETVNACLEIGRGSELSDEKIDLLSVAAWFHDTGYLFKVDGHEESSSEIALNFLKEKGYPAERIKQVTECILSTKVSYSPQNLLQSIICDADLITLGRGDYFEKNDLLKLEIEKRENKNIDELTWLKRSFHFLSSHNYYTEYARLKYDPQLHINITELKKMIDQYS